MNLEIQNIFVLNQFNMIDSESNKWYYTRYVSSWNPSIGCENFERWEVYAYCINYLTIDVSLRKTNIFSYYFQENMYNNNQQYNTDGKFEEEFQQGSG